MKPNKNITILLLTLWCVACSSSERSNHEHSNQSSTEKLITSRLDRIERAFDKGDISSACDLQLKLSKDLVDFAQISPELLRSVKEFQMKCGSSSFSIDF